MSNSASPTPYADAESDERVAGVRTVPNWRLVGNSLANTTAFLGTTNAQPLIMKTNGSERLRIAPTGAVGVGTADPHASLDIAGTLRFQGYPKASLPSPGVIGRLARVVDDTHGIWMDMGDQWFSVNGESLNVKEFGARGNGASDDTAAIQSAFSAAAAHGGAVFFPPGTYRITSNLFLWGNVDVIGASFASVLQLDANLLGGNEYWICLGLPAIGAVTHQYSGLWRNLTISATANAGASHSFNVFNAVNYGWVNCVFDFTAPGEVRNVGSIGCQDNGNYSKGLYIRKNALIDGCTFTWRQSVCKPVKGEGGRAEGIGHANAQRVRIVDNIVNGAGDDAIGLHRCDDVVVSGNLIFTIQGAILLASVRRAVVANNELRYELIDYDPSKDSALATGMGIHAIVEGGPAPQDLRIVNNLISYPVGAPAGGYFIRMRGARNVSITGNQCLNYHPTGLRAIAIESMTVPGWIDPDGIDKDSTARVYNVQVIGNVLVAPTGGSVGGSISVEVPNADHAPGPIYLQNNIADRYDLSFPPSKGAHVAGNLLGFTQLFTAFNINGHNIADAAMVASWYESNVPANLSQVPVRRQAGAAQAAGWVAPAAYALTRLAVTSTALQTKGNLTVQLRVNSIVRATIGPVRLEKQLATVYLGDPSVLVCAEDHIDVVITTDAQFTPPNALDLMIDLYGVELRRVLAIPMPCLEP